MTWAAADVASEAAARVPLWMREDVASEIVVVLLTRRPATLQEAREMARRTANAMRGRERRRRSMHGASLDGASLGTTHADAVSDQAAARVLLDAAVRAASAGFDFSCSRMRGRLLEND